MKTSFDVKFPVHQFLSENYPLVYKEYLKWLDKGLVFSENLYTIACFLWENKYNPDNGSHISYVKPELDKYEHDLKNKIK